MAVWSVRRGLTVGRSLAFPAVVGLLLARPFVASVTSDAWRPDTLLGPLLWIWVVWLGSSVWAGEDERALRQLLCPMRLGTGPWFLAMWAGRLGLSALPMVLSVVTAGFRHGFDQLHLRLVLVVAWVGALSAAAAFWSVATNSPLGGVVAMLQGVGSAEHVLQSLGVSGKLVLELASLVFFVSAAPRWSLEGGAPRIVQGLAAAALLWGVLGFLVAAWRKA
ncbi:MAG: hypothetical protein NZ869_06695 [Thermoanaerobaculum sp.]|nr:hypothetical protein [Thermoanaerobaculum sp.]MDW7967945.1 hypothetical protein [Thermoanaerobaculum sp.]